MADVVTLRGMRPARLRAGLSLQAVATKMGVSRQAIYQWETGSRWPTPDRIPALAQALEITIDELYYGNYEGGSEN